MSEPLSTTGAPVLSQSAVPDVCRGGGAAADARGPAAQRSAMSAGAIRRPIAGIRGDMPQRMGKSEPQPN